MTASIEYHRVKAGPHFLGDQASVDALMTNPNVAHVDGDDAPFWSRFSGAPIYIGECPCDPDDLARLRASSGSDEAKR